MGNNGAIGKFLLNNYRHFNAATLVDAAMEYHLQVSQGKKMMVTLGGAMSTAELGVSLAEMIRQDKVHAITCTGANLEEDIYNLVAHSKYERITNYRDLKPEDEALLLAKGLNRVTDTCIPEEEAFRVLEKYLVELWVQLNEHGMAMFPHQIFYQLLREGDLEKEFEIDPKDSWVYAACEKDIPIFVPGWEDSTCGNIFAAHCIRGDVRKEAIRSGIEYMMHLSEWYLANQEHGIGFFQIGGGIAGDFPICVVPMIAQDLGLQAKAWSYFCQISDSTTSYGSYSGAVPNEKITWGKLEVDTPTFIIESDATIVAPLIFAFVLGQ
jgi:deoxyhypusine synthase